MIPLLGYSNKLSGRPGDTIEFKVSSRSSDDFYADLVRVVCADPNPDGPGIIENDINAAFAGRYPSRAQDFHSGSCVQIRAPKALDFSSLTLTALIWPTLLNGRNQTILSLADSNGECQLDLALGASGELCANVYLSGSRWSCSSEEIVTLREWQRVWVSCSASDGTLSLGFARCGQNNPTLRSLSMSDTLNFRFDQIAFASVAGAHPKECFNGKIEAPALFNRTCGTSELTALLSDDSRQHAHAHWDFCKNISGTQVLDSGVHQLHGTTINYPTRGVTGSLWDGTEMCWRHKPEHYGAIHFHEDDIVDFEWQTDFEFTIPENIRSGIYAARIRCGDFEDKIPFFVLPEKNKSRASLCVLVSTFTYSIYGNHARPDYDELWQEKWREWNAYPWNPAEYPEYGLSTYNNHADGSGICHASHRRPLFTLRPGYVTFGYGESGLRHFQADTHLIAWLENKGIDYDIVTDWELHHDGADSIAKYKCVTTGSHPEYHTKETLNALRDYRDSGGNLIYIGGNGFYWRVALSSENPSIIEIRRGEGGIRAWASEPGEYYNAFDGEYGGLWRRNARPPQQLAAVGFSGQGQFVGSYYRRTEASNQAEVSWIFAGVNDDIIGDFGLSGGGAAGFEVDRVDHRLGTPSNAVVVARSENHGDTFVLVPEERLTHITALPDGDPNDAIRADMTYCDYPGGGAVFSVGSITFCGSLPHNEFDNSVSRILKNVVKRFTDVSA
ncbi:MAG: N,N-dimethylformamidase beta subunit family domain-containing protein [Pseudomonadota bacterium]